MATKLTLYNGALRECGETALDTLTDDIEGRYYLDAVYAQGLKYCLNQGQWNFAIRASEFEFDTNVEPVFGYMHAFDKPDDFVRIVGISGNPSQRPPLADYKTEGGFWFADVSPLYIRYVSDDGLYGGDLAGWPSDYELAVELWLARLIVQRLTGSQSKTTAIKKDSKQAFKDARSKDAMADPAARWQQGRLTQARQGGNISTYETLRDPNA